MSCFGKLKRTFRLSTLDPGPQPRDSEAIFNYTERRVTFLDINEKFLEPDGTLPTDIMPDLLHPNEKGYQIWADAMEPNLKKLLK